MILNCVHFHGRLNVIKVTFAFNTNNSLFLLVLHAFALIPVAIVVYASSTTVTLKKLEKCIFLIGFGTNTLWLDEI